jgi:hypothetical protein
MFSYDLPYKNCSWRTPSFLLSDQKLYDYWNKVLTDVEHSSLFLMYFKDAKEHPLTEPRWEPFMKHCDLWKSMGPGRRHTTEEVLALDNLVGIELIKQHVYVPVYPVTAA